MDTESALKINKYIHEQCVDGVPHDIGWNVVKLFCQPAVSGSGKIVCPDCGDRGWLYDEQANRTGTCPCHLR